MAELEAGFDDPPPFHRPAMFWAWNADPTVEMIADQLRQMRDAGVGAVVLMPMPADFRPADFIDGMHIPYLSEEFFRLVRVAVEHCAQLGTRFWIYDEGGWPSGIARGQVTEGHPEFRGKVLKRAGPGFSVAYEGYPTDLLSPAAVRRFIALTHEGYKRSIGEFFGGTVVGLFTDEMKVGGAVGSEAIPWTERLPDEFEARKGYGVEEILPLLFAGAPEGPRTEQARADFCEVVTALFAEAYFKQTAEWCQANGLLFTGHLGGEDDLLGPHWARFGSFFATLEHLHVPGVDAIWRQIFPGVRRADFPKLASSVAHQRGRAYCMTESFAVYGWGLTPAQMKWVTDHQFVRGINVMQTMMVCLKADQYGLANTASHLGKGNPLWEHFDLYAKYSGRLSWALSLGTPAARVALYLPEEARWAGAASVGDSVTYVAEALLRRQIDFDFVGKGGLERARVASGALAVGAMSYQAIVIPHAPVVSATTMERLARFSESGGLVVFCQKMPQRPSERRAEGRFAAAKERLMNRAEQDGTVVLLSEPSEEHLAAALSPAAPPDLILRKPNPDIRYCHRRLRDADLYLVTNEAARAKRVALRLEGQGEATLWDPERGKRRRLRRREGWVSLRLPGWGTAMVTVGAPPATLEPPMREWRRVATLEGPWMLRRLRAWEITEQGHLRESEDSAHWLHADLGDWRKFVGEHFSGIAQYRCEFEVPQPLPDGEWAIDLGRVAFVAKVTLNGKEAGRRAWEPYRVEVTEMLKEGANVLEVEVTNTLADQSLRPEVLAMMREKGWRNGYRAKAEAFEAESLGGGLYGPVTLQVR